MAKSGEVPEPAVALEPAQPEAVSSAVAGLLEPGVGGSSSWWRAGITDALGDQRGVSAGGFTSGGFISGSGSGLSAGGGDAAPLRNSAGTDRP
jgi:hypothetical protein